MRRLPLRGDMGCGKPALIREALRAGAGRGDVQAKEALERWADKYVRR